MGFRRGALLALVFCLSATVSFAKKKHDRGLPRTEVGLMNNVLGCLVNKDSVSYFELFPPFDTLWYFVIHNTDKTPETLKALNALKEHPQDLLQFDPYYNHAIMGRFYNIIKKGEDSGIHWNEVVMERYEIYSAGPTLSLAGYEKIAPERFRGYMFVRDVLGRETYCITIKEIQKIQGYYFGGQVINILQASNVDEYLQKEKDEARYLDWLSKHPDTDTSDTTSKKGLDSLTADQRDSIWKSTVSLRDSIVNDDEVKQTRKEVIDRKYYEGLFDNEIPVKLYIRYMKDPKSRKNLAYDGLYKFGDQEHYVKLTITLNADGKWEMEDELPLGSMELTLKDKIYRGSWLNNESQTGYDVLLHQADIPEKKLELLDKILEKGLAGRADDDTYDSDDNSTRGKGKKRKKDDDDDDDDDDKTDQPPKPAPPPPPVNNDEGY